MKNQDFRGKNDPFATLKINFNNQYLFSSEAVRAHHGVGSITALLPEPAASALGVGAQLELVCSCGYVGSFACASCNITLG